MTQEIPITIQEIDDQSPYLETVIGLGDANKATLSFFAKGAFIDHAKQGEIIVAIAPQVGCIGYLLYDCSRRHNRVTLIHLCLNSSYRGNGISRQLVAHLIQKTQEYSGIGLTCRRDYNLQNMWSSFGFVFQYDEPAKTPGKWNEYWWLDHGHTTLFSIAATYQRESKLCVVIDANIFFDIYKIETIESEDSKSLLSDWLQPELDLWLTDEIFNKINTIGNRSERKKLRELAKNFRCLSCQNKILNESELSLNKFLSSKDIFLDEYDLRYLARTIAAESHIHIFVTHDARLLNIADDIYERFKLSIFSPNELIRQLDDLRIKPEYQPVRLAGTQLQQNHVISGQENILNEYFQSHNCGENKAEFQQKLRRFLAEPNKFECWVVWEGENKPLALVIYDRHKKHELEIPMLRVCENALGSTIAEHLLFQAASLSAREQRQFTRITDPRLQETVTQAIQKDAFTEVENGWVRANIAVAETAAQLSQRLNDLNTKFGNEYNFCSQIANTLNMDTALQDIPTILEIERLLFPAKIIDAAIPNFIISIKPFWAQNLFDEELANQTIFGAMKHELALNREAVYYKSKTAPRQLHPGTAGRILWYVTSDKDQNNDQGYKGISSIRACSRLDEVLIGKPKDLYRCFRNLGIYEFQQVLNIADSNVNKDIMAIQFSDTELFNNPVPFKKIQEILGKQITFQSPSYIDCQKFAIIYHIGTNK